MPNRTELTKEDRIKKEIKRLNNIFKDLDIGTKSSLEGLIKRAAFMRISLEDYEIDLLMNGYTEYFTQSEKLEPYERERPVARLYNAMSKNYQSIIKQLSDVLPRATTAASKDELLEFIR